MVKNKEQSPLPPVAGRKVVLLMSFPDALQAVIGGQKVRRVEWSDSNEYGLLKDSFLMIHRNDKFHTWIVSEGDMMAVDWVIVK